MDPPDRQEDKLIALRRHHAVNPRPLAVTDPTFNGGNPFFDAQDLVQVKYEMLRRVHQESHSVTQASAAFGFSRPSFYQAQAIFAQAGLPGLIPQRPGPKRAHKLSDRVVDLLEDVLANDPSLSSARLARWLEEQLGLSAHPRSVERALARRKRGLQAQP
ncbi:MAG TPA: helix-turn-helix domain containing protein [Candidatus Acidoferrales bacterium]|nr:helix-turn-helix domain containing protein [Candidatus Acidoferrales bacterium]